MGKLVDGGVPAGPLYHVITPGVDHPRHGAIARDVLAVIPAIPFRIHVLGNGHTADLQAGAMPRSGCSTPAGKICSPRIRVMFLPITLGDMRRLQGVGLARYFWKSALCSTAALVNSYTARYLGPPFSATYRAPSRKPGKPNKSGRCSVLYQALNSSSSWGQYRCTLGKCHCLSSP